MPKDRNSFDLRFFLQLSSTQLGMRVKYYVGRINAFPKEIAGKSQEQKEKEKSVSNGD